MRRAVSAAYYALYHHIAGEVAAQALPDCTDDERWELTRHLKHAAIKQVCDWIASPSTPPKKVSGAVNRLRGSGYLVDVSLSFQTLQDARHAADYDHTAGFSKPTTLSLIDEAQDAISKVTACVGSSEFSLMTSYVLLKSAVSN